MRRIHNRQRRRVGRSVNQFTINNKTYSIRLSDHAELRLKQRNVDLYQVIGTILLLGETKIENYAGTERDIFIQNKELGFSVVVSILVRTIKIITVIHSADCFVKEGTELVNL